MEQQTFSSDDSEALSVTFNTKSVREAVESGYVYAVMGDGLLQKDYEKYARDNTEASLRLVTIPVKGNDERDIVFFNNARIARDFSTKASIYKDFGILKISIEQNKIKAVPAAMPKF